MSKKKEAERAGDPSASAQTSSRSAGAGPLDRASFLRHEVSVPRWAWFSLAFAAGAGTMVFELTAPRVMQPFFGSSSFVWTNVIGVILLALALGYHWGGRLAGRAGAPQRIAILLLGATAIAALIPWVVPPIGHALLPEVDEVVDAAALRRGLQLGSLLVAMLLFAPPAFMLAAVTPQIVSRVAFQVDDAGRAAGRVFAAGTIGSLVGTFLPTYVLIPAIGSRGSLLIAAAILGIPGAFLLLRGRARATAALTTLVLLIVSATALQGRPLRAALPGETGLEEIESSYQYLRVVEGNPIEPSLQGKRELFLRIDEGVSQDFHSEWLIGEKTTGGKYYDTFALLPSLFPDRKDLRVAILGSGAGTMARLFREFWNERIEAIVNIEIDPEVIALEERFGYRHQRGDRSLALDGRSFLAATRENFDIIIVDAYARQIDIPFHLVTREFFELSRRRLKTDGILALNVSGSDLETGLVQGIGRSLEDGGYSRIQATPVQYWGNIMLWSRGGGAANWNDPERLPRELQTVGRYASRFTAELPVQPEAPRLVDNHAPVESLTDRWLKGD